MRSQRVGRLESARPRASMVTAAAVACCGEKRDESKGREGARVCKGVGGDL